MYKSECTYTCKPGYGFKSTVPIIPKCVGNDTGGYWDKAEPPCERKCVFEMINFVIL